MVGVIMGGLGRIRGTQGVDALSGTDRMDRQTFLAQLNLDAEARFGVLVTDTMLKKWLDKRMIRSPTKHGRRREWGQDQYIVALEICRLQSQCVRSNALMKWHLWLQDLPIPVFNPSTEREALVKEFRRLRKSLLSAFHSTYAPSNGVEIEEWRAESIVRHMRNLDPRLAKFVQYSSDELLDMFVIAKQGDSLDKLAGAIDRLLAKLWDAISVPAELRALLISQMPDSRVLAESIRGLLGDRDEIEGSAEETIETVTIDRFGLAKHALRRLPDVLGILTPPTPHLLHAPARDLTDAIEAIIAIQAEPIWRIALFVIFLHSIEPRGGSNFVQLIALLEGKLDGISPDDLQAWLKSQDSSN